MSAPARTTVDRIPYTYSLGADLVGRPNTPTEQVRLWLENDTYPRIVLDTPNHQVLVGDGTVAPTPLSGGGGGGGGDLLAANNLSDVANAQTALKNISGFLGNNWNAAHVQNPETYFTHGGGTPGVPGSGALNTWAMEVASPGPGQPNAVAVIQKPGDAWPRVVWLSDPTLDYMFNIGDGTFDPVYDGQRAGLGFYSPGGAIGVTALRSAAAVLSASEGFFFDDGVHFTSLSQFLDLSEIATPANPGGDSLRVYAKDTAGQTELRARDSAGLDFAIFPFDNDTTLAADSATRAPTQHAVRTFVNNAVTGLLDFKGSTDCSANPNYPAALKGDAYIVSVAGKIGGAAGKAVDVGDVYVASADNAGGTEAAVGTSWFVLEHNLQGALLAANNLSDVANAGTARSNLGVAIGTNVQAWAADLDAIGALTPANDDIIQRKAGAWTNRTLAQYRADLGFGATAPFVTTLDIQTFTAAGTWTKPTGAKRVHAWLWGAGGGGAGGSRQPAGTASGCGGGGGGGAVSWASFDPADLGATETVTPGAAGTAGNGATADGTAGTAGSAGGQSTFGTTVKLAANGGTGGNASATGNGTGGGGGTNTAGYVTGALSVGVAGVAGGAGGIALAGSVGTSSGQASGCGGGGAGGLSAANVPQNGGAGGAPTAGGSGVPLYAGGTAGASGGGNGGNGATPNTVTQFAGSGGGGGGAGDAAATVTGGTGGTGGPGSGGGGGGGARNGKNGGNGGPGGPGRVVVITELSN